MRSGWSRTAPLLLMGVMLLAACAPAVSSTVTDTDSATATYTKDSKASGLYDLTFFAGMADVVNARFTITGSDIKLNAPTYCKALSAQVVCTVPTIPAGKNFLLPMTGSNLCAVVLYKRTLAGDDFKRKACA